jgi:MFS family permease
MVADVSTDRDRGSNFGVLRAMDNLGAVLGVIATLILFGILRLGYRNVFLIAAIPSIIGAVLIFFVIKEKRPAKEAKKPTISYKDLGRLDDRFWAFTSVSVIFALANFNFSFLIIYAVDSGIHTDVTILLYLLFNLVAALMAYPFGKVADNVGRVPILLLSFAIFCLMCWAFTIAHAIMTVIMLFVLYGLFKAALEPVEKAYVCEIVPPDLKASGLGVYLMATGITALPASFLTGYLWEVYGLAAPFTFSAVLAAIACLGLLLVIGRYRGRGSRTTKGPCV